MNRAHFIEPFRRVRYRSENGRRMTATVADYLFPVDGKIPILKRSKVIWIDRKKLRKLPA